MTDITIDVSQDEDDAVSVENAELSWIRISVAGVTLEVNWEQAGNLFRELGQFFDPAPSPACQRTTTP